MKKMKNAEIVAIERYPVCHVINPETLLSFDLNQEKRDGFIQGYKEAEKDYTPEHPDTVKEAIKVLTELRSAMFASGTPLLPVVARDAIAVAVLELKKLPKISED